MRKLYKGEKDGRRILNGHEKISRGRLNTINLERSLSLSAAESQGRIRVQQENDSIRMEY